jgi:Flp pilus assembly pilin Flp
MLMPSLRRNRQASSRLSWKRRLLLGAVWFVVLAPTKVLATAIEYAVMLALITVVTIVGRGLPPGSMAVIHELQSAITAAQAANAGGHSRKELSHLSKALGLEEALMDMAASCDTCGEVTADLQELIGLTSKLRARVLITPGCKPDGVIASNEECDPLAAPTGCPTGPIPTFCTDTCQCAEVVTTTTMTTTSTTSTTLCLGGQTDCSGSCVDLTSDPDNCGGCGTVCPPAAPVCISSMCTIP